MADQRQLNAHLLNGVLSLLRDYDEDGEKKNLSYAEAVQALQYTIDSIQTRIPLDFTQKEGCPQGMREFTREDFLQTTKPYECLLQKRSDPLAHEQAFAAVQENARMVGIRNFCELYRCYETEVTRR